MATRTPNSDAKPPADPLARFLPKGDPSRPYVAGSVPRRPTTRQKVDKRRKVESSRHDRAVAQKPPAASAVTPATLAEPVVPAQPVVPASLPPAAAQEPALPPEPVVPTQEPSIPLEPALAGDEPTPAEPGVPLPSNPTMPPLALDTIPVLDQQRRPGSAPGSIRSRRKSKTAPVVMSLASVGLAIVVGILGYLVFRGDQRLLVAKDGSGVTVAQKTAPSNNRDRRQDDEEFTITVPADDPILQSAGADSSPSRANSNSLGPSLANDLADSDQPMTDSMSDRPQNMDTAPIEDSGTPAIDADAEEPSMDTTAQPSPTMVAAPDAEKTEAGREAMMSAFDAIKSGDLKQMAEATKEAVKRAANRGQQETAARMEQLVDLAVFYEGAVDRTINQLEASQVLNITPSLIASVVEASSDRLALKINGKVKRFDRDSFPLILIDHLAADSLPDGDATALAAKASYHAVSKSAGTPNHRQQAIGWLNTLAGSETQVNVAGVTETIRELVRGYLFVADEK